jgi:hypothetical protein
MTMILSWASRVLGVSKKHAHGAVPFRALAPMPVTPALLLCTIGTDKVLTCKGNTHPLPVPASSVHCLSNAEMPCWTMETSTFLDSCHSTCQSHSLALVQPWRSAFASASFDSLTRSTLDTWTMWPIPNCYEEQHTAPTNKYCDH